MVFVAKKDIVLRVGSNDDFDSCLIVYIYYVNMLSGFLFVWKRYCRENFAGMFFYLITLYWFYGTR